MGQHTELIPIQQSNFSTTAVSEILPFEESIIVAKEQIQQNSHCQSVACRSRTYIRPTTVYPGQTSITYSVPEIANATSYTWTLPMR